jgi:phenylacetate-CoA ligase
MLPLEVLFLRRLIKDQWLTPSELQALQEDKLRRLIVHAYDRVPYYRRLFDSAKLKPSDIQGLPDLTKIPTTSRARLIEQPLKDITARGIDLRRCRAMTTSGTTGAPLKTYYRRKDLTRINLGWARAYLAHGMRARDRIGAFRGWQTADPKKTWYERLGILRRRTLSSMDDPAAWITELQKWKPQVLMGYSMTLKLLAAAVRERRADRLRPRLIFHTSGLIHDHEREDIEEALGSKVIDLYGSDEGGCIAWECRECRGYHVNVDLIALEIVEDGRTVPAGTPGEVVITNLHSFAMPLIRYRQDDVAAWSPEAPICGRGLPLLREIQGRVDDFIVLPSGGRISPHPFYWALLLVPGISKWRVIQETRNLLRIEVVPGPDFQEDGPSMIEANVRKIVKDGMEITVSVLDAIEHNPLQKFRSVISKARAEG